MFSPKEHTIAQVAAVLSSSPEKKAQENGDLFALGSVWECHSFRASLMDRLLHVKLCLESSAIWILVPPLIMCNLFLRCRHFSCGSLHWAIWSLWKVSEWWFPVTNPQKSVPADSIPVPSHGKWDCVYCSVLSQRGSSFQMESVTLSSDPTLALPASVSDILSSNTIMLSLPNLSYAEVWTQKPYVGSWHV